MIAKILTNNKKESIMEFNLLENKEKIPINRKDLYKLRYNNLHTVINIIQKHKVIYWLQGKTMLGMCRDNKLIENDHDEDLGLFETDIESVCTKVIPDLLLEGFKVIRATKNDSMLSIMKGPRYIDLCFFSNKNNDIGYENKWFPKDFYKEFISISINDFNYQIPKKYKQICHYSYNTFIEDKNSRFNNINILDTRINKFINDHIDRHFMYKLLYPSIGDYLKHKENKNILNIGIDWHNKYEREFINNESISFYGLDRQKKLNSLPEKWKDIFYLDLTIKNKTIEILNKFQVIIDYGVIGWGYVHNNLNFNQIKNYIDNVKYLLNKNGIYCLKIDINDSNKYEKLLDYILSQLKVTQFNDINNFDIYVDNKIKYKTFILSV